MKQNIFIAALLAGMLALAGCGGGGSVTAPPANTMVDDMDDDKEMTDDTEVVEEEETEPTPATFSNVDASGASFVTGEGGAPEEGVVSPLGSGRNAIVGNVTLTCPSTAGTNGCQWRISGGNIQATGGVTAVVTPLPVTPTVVATPADGNWLSKGSIVEAVPAAGTLTTYDVVINGVQQQIDGSGRLGTTPDSKVEDLLISHTRTESDNLSTAANDTNDFLVFGTWLEPATLTNTSVTPKQVWHGSMPRVAPVRKQADNATYTGGVHGFFKAGASGTWTAWTGAALLTANFVKGEVSGMIDNDASNTTVDVLDEPGIMSAGVSHISLKGATFADSLSGKVTIVGTGAAPGSNAITRNAPSSGTWEGGFFGPSGADPTGIAGAFNAERKEAAAKSTGLPTTLHSAVEVFHINGAFEAQR